MSAAVVFTFGLFLTFAGLALLVRRIIRPIAPPSPDWLDTFSVDRYRPMQRLLAPADFAFLESECGYSAAAIRKVRAERRRIFRMYLRNLTRDFNRIHYAGRILLLNSPVDRPDLAEKLFRARWTFLWALATIHFRLVLNAVGGRHVDVLGLLGSIEGLRLDCAALNPARAAAY